MDFCLLTTFQLLAHAHGVGTVWDGICMMALGVCPEVVGRLGILENHTLGYALPLATRRWNTSGSCSGVQLW